MNALASAIRRIELPTLRVNGGLLSGLSVRHLVLAVVFTVGYDVLGHLGLIDLTELPNAARWKGFAKMPFHLATACIAVLAAVAAENTFQAGVARILRYPIAAMLAAVAGTWLFEISSSPIGERSAKILTVLANVADVHLVLRTGHFLTALYISILVISLHAVFEARHRAASALHRARLQALDEERDVCETELRAMQARVDPDVLFESLRSVDHAYASDPAVGQARLDALIRFLRAALPGKTAVRSTVEHELELAESYLELVAPVNSTAPCVDFKAATSVLREAMPAMIVLPLVRWALAGQPADRLTISVNRRADQSGAILELVVENRLATESATDSGETAIVRERLECLYAQDTRFDVLVEANRRRAVVAIPTRSVSHRLPAGQAPQSVASHPFDEVAGLR